MADKEDATVPEAITQWETRSEVTSAYKGQINGHITALNEQGTPIGALDYQQYGDEVLIAWIGVTPDYQHKGVATQLYKALQKEWSDKKITWGMTTPEGTVLRKSIEKAIAEAKPPAVKPEVIRGTEPGGIKTLSIQDKGGEVISSLAYTEARDSIILDSMGTVETARQQGLQTRLWNELTNIGKPIETRAGTLTDDGESFIQSLENKGFNIVKTTTPEGMSQYTISKPPAVNPEVTKPNPGMSETDKKEDTQVLKGLLPAIGIGTAVIVAFALLVRTFAFGRQAHYQNGQYMVSVRFPGEWNDIRDFVQPSDPDVLAVYSQIGPDAWQLFDFVCRSVDYKSDIGEFWMTPSETLRGYGDCEDCAILLTSLIKAGGVPDCYVALGSLEGYGHAWCFHNGQILETTYSRARLVPDPQNYCPYVLFDDQEVIELWPGALNEVFALRRGVPQASLIPEAVIV